MKLTVFQNSVGHGEPSLAEMTVNFVQFYALAPDLNLPVRPAQAVHVGALANASVTSEVRILRA